MSQNATVPPPSGNSGSSALANLTAGAAGVVAPGRGPTNSQALGRNYLVGGADPVVYWGPGNVVRKNTRGGSDSREQALSDLGINKNRPNDNTKPFQEAVADWYTQSDQERAAWAQKAYRLGIINDPNDYRQAYGAWANAVQEASNFYMASGFQKKVDPWMALDIMGGISGTGPKTTTQTSKSFNIPTVEDAHAATKSIFQSLMGRDPNDNELNRYASMMTAYAQKHPQVTKQTQTRDKNGNIVQSSTSSGGYSQAGVTDMLGEQAKQDPEYGAYQAATTYFNALMQAVGTGNHG